MATQSQVRRMVEINIIQNVNILMDHLVSNPGGYETEILGVTQRLDYKNAALDEGLNVKKDSFDSFWILEEGINPDGPYDSEAEAWQAACEHHGIEPYYDDAYEFYIVSEWLARQLAKRGEMVEEIFDLTIWGRCATGQAVYLDGIMIEIYDENEVN